MPDAVTVQNPEPFNNTEQAPDLNAIVGKWRWLVPRDVEVHIRWDAEIGEEARAQSVAYIEANRLLITVRPVDADGMYESSLGFRINRNVELDVIHELPHWRFEAFAPDIDSLAFKFWECVIEQTARNYYRLAYKGI